MSRGLPEVWGPNIQSALSFGMNPDPPRSRPTGPPVRLYLGLGGWTSPGGGEHVPCALVCWLGLEHREHREHRGTLVWWAFGEKPGSMRGS